MSAALARNLNVPTNPIISMLNGQCAITGDTALRPLRAEGRKSDPDDSALKIWSAYRIEVPRGPGRLRAERIV